MTKVYIYVKIYVTIYKFNYLWEVACLKNNEMAGYFFHEGTNYYAYRYLGCMSEFDKDRYVYTFRTWAPNAISVGLVSDFTGWDNPLPLKKITDSGVWEITYISSISLEKEPYKYRITSHNGTHDKGDPYATFSRGKNDGASLIFSRSKYIWGDKRWLDRRKKAFIAKDGSYIPAPVNIYEMHFASFMRHDDNTVISYREMADILPAYLKKMGYTHVEFLPLQEYPYDRSWGYQVCGFYAPTSRFGDPDDYRYLIDTLHKHGIGVIMDWVPAHFPKDEWGLYEYDGTQLYEYQSYDRRESRSWGTCFFDLGRREVRSFLISNALYYLREFHIDGLRVDAVASMIYLDFDKQPGEWIPNSDGGNENYEAAAFLKELNRAISDEFPDVLMIAEESTAFAGITKPISDGGLGFNLKWNMGWANDFYNYVAIEPADRRFHHSALNFPIMYAFSENYCMPISHDEVVHGKKSFIDKMHGAYDDKFAQARVALMLQMTYPGKKLLFMGTEYGQFREWDFDNSLEWFMLDYPKHRELRDYTAALNEFYLAHSELWECDFISKGFEWLLADENKKNLVAFKRYNLSGESLIVILSFSDSEQEVRIKTADALYLEAIFDTGNLNLSTNIFSINHTANEHSADIKIPAFSGVILTEQSRTRKIKL